MGRQAEKAGEQRREFILSRWDQGRLSFSEIVDALKLPNDKALYKDAKILQRAGKSIMVRDRAFIFGGVKRTKIDQRRAEETPEKNAIGKLGAEVVLAPAGFPLPAKTGSESLRNVHEMLGIPRDYLQQPFVDKLVNCWERSTRTLMIDSGTTNEAIVRAIIRVGLPCPKRGITVLRVLTNGLSLAQAISDGGEEYELYPVFGKLRRDTGAFAGLEAQKFLEWQSSLFFPDIAIVGTTAVDKEGNLYCDSLEEKLGKQKMLQVARIKCIAASSTKLIRSVGGNCVFARYPTVSRSASTTQSEESPLIDCIITDANIWSAEKGAKAFLKMIRNEGISLIAREPRRQPLHAENETEDDITPS
jgi:DeoR/GlpR family transcriptional regulator of sugar metabolism